ncbi:polysaccharide deacetylase family protein [Ktedonospora formicarum]|uniref:NodB homology domain-containing protein n=1 Tax=Ktedonospora formicarum TaxID=2778364 RepID=A0A8J3IAC1_9CHLR|nr:polysaccharide deacetylase family protein [Ktedonospora formicarum]GHO48394.1 hypothetical protein KSX_65570 [Ktedonospora formicarum]
MTHGNRALPKVALTFDDGPGIYTQQILAILEKYSVQATFFFIGQNVAQYPMYVRRTLTGGHAIGNHTFTHPHLPTLPSTAIYEELARTQSSILSVAETITTIFRPPYGEYTPKVITIANQLDLTVITWSADASDWHDPQPSSTQIAESILDAADNGAIFLLHEGNGNRANTVAALPTIIEGLQERGLQLVTIPQMLTDLKR